MSSFSDSPEWSDLQSELDSVARTANAFNAYVFDAWENMCCAARGFSPLPREDLLDLIRAALRRTGLKLYRGAVLATAVSGPVGHAYLRTYGSCYVLLLRFPGPFDRKHARAVVDAALPTLEALTLRLPPLGGPGAQPDEMAQR